MSILSTRAVTQEVMRAQERQYSAKSTDTQIRLGLWAAITAYTIWGFLPIYLKLVASVPPLEILAHRILWSVPFGALLITIQRQWPSVTRAFTVPRVMGLLLCSSLAVAFNWGIYIWSIQQNQIFQASLGYYINPLLYVLVGAVFFGDRLSKLQMLAVLLAAVGVGVLIVYGGTFPILGLALAVSFTLYGVIRKQVDIDAMPGLFIETLLLLFPAIIYMAWLAQHGQFAFTQVGLNLQFLLLLAGPITVIPLVAFAFAARRLRLSTIGILQFIGPTLQFGCGLYYGEAFTPAFAICFTLIWIAVSLFCWDALRRRPKRLRSSTELG